MPPALNRTHGYRILASRMLAALAAALLLAGSIHASARDRSRTTRVGKQPDSGAAISRGGGFILAVEVAGDTAASSDEVLSGGRLRLAGELNFVVASIDEDAGPHSSPTPDHEIGDGVRLLDRLATLLGQWGMCDPPIEPCSGDLDGDGLVGPADLCRLLSGQ